MPRPGYTPRSTPEQHRERMNRLAERVANGMTIKDAAADMGLPPTTGNSLFAAIRRGLGWQAS